MINARLISDLLRLRFFAQTVIKFSPPQVSDSGCYVDNAYKFMIRL